MLLISSKVNITAAASEENQKHKATKHQCYYVPQYFQMCKQTSEKKKLKDLLNHLNTQTHTRT